MKSKSPGNFVNFVLGISNIWRMTGSPSRITRREFCHRWLKKRECRSFSKREDKLMWVGLVRISERERERGGRWHLSFLEKGETQISENYESERWLRRGDGSWPNYELAERSDRRRTNPLFMVRERGRYQERFEKTYIELCEGRENDTNDLS